MVYVAVLKLFAAFVISSKGIRAFIINTFNHFFQTILLPKYL